MRLVHPISLTSLPKTVLGIAVVTSGLTLAVAEVGAVTIDFETETVGVKAQPYAVGGLTIQIVDFSPGPLPPSIQIIGFGPLGSGCAAGGKCLNSGSDSVLDGAFNFALPGIFNYFSVDFGNDDPDNFAVGGLAAEMRASLGGGEVGVSQLNANVDDLVNQTISIFVPGGFDAVNFRYLSLNTGNTAALTKVLDNVVYDTLAVPEPETLALFGLELAGLCAIRRRRIRTVTLRRDNTGKTGPADLPR